MPLIIPLLDWPLIAVFGSLQFVSPPTYLALRSSPFSGTGIFIAGFTISSSIKDVGSPSAGLVFESVGTCFLDLAQILKLSSWASERPLGVINYGVDQIC